MPAKLAAENVTKLFGEGSARVHALDNVSVEISEGEMVCILGPSGCGKTTLLSMFGGLEWPTRGRVLIDGREIRGPGRDRAMVFQEYTVFPWKTVRNNVRFALRLKGITGSIRDEITAHFIRLAGLNGFEDRYPGQLSGGMRQRLALATCLSIDPEVLLMDEPLGACDAFTRVRLQEETIRIWFETKKTFLMVTHSISEAVVMGQTIVVMSARPGRIQQVIRPGFSYPRRQTDPAVRELEEEIMQVLSRAEYNQARA
jgi:ABC-type nitrate/sulfonate/bicarbonate transport system ATPase subunit